MPAGDLRVGCGVREGEALNQRVAAPRDDVHGPRVRRGVDDAHLRAAGRGRPQVFFLNLRGRVAVGHQAHRGDGVGAAGGDLKGDVDDGGRWVAHGVDGHLPRACRRITPLSFSHLCCRAQI